jgi:hypothetical protein
MTRFERALYHAAPAPLQYTVAAFLAEWRRDDGPPEEHMTARVGAAIADADGAGGRPTAGAEIVRPPGPPSPLVAVRVAIGEPRPRPWAIGVTPVVAPLAVHTASAPGASDPAACIERNANDAHPLPTIDRGSIA